MKKISAALGLALALTACATEQAPPTAPVIYSRDLAPKIVMNVKTISLADRSGLQPSNTPYKNEQFYPTISEAIKQWAIDRLQANGQAGQAVILIKKASLAAHPLPIKKGIDSWFARQQDMKYVANAEISIEASSKEGFAVVEATAARSITLPQDPTELEKQNAYYTMLNGLMQDLGKSIESGIHTHMTTFLSPTPILGSTAIPETRAQEGSAPTAQAPDASGNAAPPPASSPDVATSTPERVAPTNE